MARIYTCAEQLIGKTPLLELTQLEQKLGLEARILAKLEYFNPAGSAKDRVAKAMKGDKTLASELELLQRVRVALDDTLPFSLPISFKDWTVILTEVAVIITPMKIAL